jgi:hypothetical protein
LKKITVLKQFPRNLFFKKMYSKIFIPIILTVASMSFVQGFHGLPRKISPVVKKSSVIVMNSWGVQKLGQTVIDITTASPETSNVSSMFKRTAIGSGRDERESNSKEDEVDEVVLSTIGRNFQQKRLLYGLEHSSWGTAEKLQRISLAASLDGLLPETFASESIQGSHLHAGGLLDDWA